MHLSVILLSIQLVGAWWVGHKKLTFERARSYCSPGDLATFSTNQELMDLLRTNQDLMDLLQANQELRKDLAYRSTVHLWLGLEKPKNMCVVQVLPLRGFRWIDERQDSELSVWSQEPDDTCTNARCGALAVDSYNQSYGLVSRTCKTKNWFICGPRLAERPARTTPDPAETRPRPPETRPGPAETRPGSAETRPGPAETRPGPEGTRPRPPETRPGPPETREPGLDPNPGLNEEQTQVSPSFVPDPDLGPGLVSTPASSSPAPSSGLRPGPGPVHRSCALPVVPGSRSLSLESGDRDLVLVECWSGAKLMLRCSNGDWVWTEGPQPSLRDPGLDQGLTRDQNWTLETVCHSVCGPGLQLRDGQCEDVDECSLSPAPCAHGCVNAHGSFTCTPLPSAVLVPVLVVVAVVMLVVVVVVTVWCCIRKKKRHRKEKKQDQNQTEA